MIEDAIETFPVRDSLKNGVQVLIRPAEADDKSAFEEFLAAVPDDELAFARHRRTDGSRFHEWVEPLDFEWNLPILAFADGKLIGDLTLHQREGGWKRHIGLISLLTHPEFRNIGLVDVLIAQAIEIAKHAGLTRLEAEFNGDRAVAIKALGLCGFVELARVPNYVQDLSAQYHDYVLMGMELIPPDDLLEAGD